MDSILVSVLFNVLVTFIRSLPQVVFIHALEMPSTSLQDGRGGARFGRGELLIELLLAILLSMSIFFSYDSCFNFGERKWFSIRPNISNVRSLKDLVKILEKL